MTYWLNSTAELVSPFQPKSANTTGTALTGKLDLESQIIGRVRVSRCLLLRNLALVIQTEECLIKGFHTLINRFLHDVL